MGDAVIVEKIPTEEELSREIADQLTPAFGPFFGVDNALTLPVMESTDITTEERDELATQLSAYNTKRRAARRTGKANS